MPARDGDGWVDCRCGERHWGRFGAAGLLLVRAAGPQRQVLLQHRPASVHQGGTWALPGGARDSHEDVVTTALREAAEEVGVTPSQVDVRACVRGVDHGDWSYAYVVAAALPQAAPRIADAETAGLAWAPVRGPLPPRVVLHPGLRRYWAALLSVARAVEVDPPPDRPS